MPLPSWLQITLVVIGGCGAVLLAWNEAAKWDRDAADQREADVEKARRDRRYVGKDVITKLERIAQKHHEKVEQFAKRTRSAHAGKGRSH